MQLNHARAMFYIAAIFNFVAVGLLYPATGIAAMLGLDPAPDSGVFSQIALLAIFAFGIGYGMVARDPTQNRGIVITGMLSKLGVVAIAVAHFLAGSANVRLLMLVSGDLLFALAFLYFLTARVLEGADRR